MLNKIFGRAYGTIYKLNWVPLIYFIAFQGTIFNWAKIISESLPSFVASSQGGMTQKRTEFYMLSYLIDCIFCRNPFSKLRCICTPTEASIYVSYQTLWDHKYVGYYKLICEEFMMPLYEIIFLKEPTFMSDNAMEVITEYGDYYFS